jgi:hypothetical protein
VKKVIKTKGETQEAFRKREAYWKKKYEEKEEKDFQLCGEYGKEWS